MDSNFLLPPFNLWECLHLSAWVEHNHKQFKFREVLNLCRQVNENILWARKSTHKESNMAAILSSAEAQKRHHTPWSLLLCCIPDSSPPFSPPCSMQASWWSIAGRALWSTRHMLGVTKVNPMLFPGITLRGYVNIHPSGQFFHTRTPHSNCEEVSTIPRPIWGFWRDPCPSCSDIFPFLPQSCLGCSTNRHFLFSSPNGKNSFLSKCLNLHVILHTFFGTWLDEFWH